MGWIVAILTLAGTIWLLGVNIDRETSGNVCRLVKVFALAVLALIAIGMFRVLMSD